MDPETIRIFHHNVQKISPKAPFYYIICSDERVFKIDRGTVSSFNVLNGSLIYNFNDTHLLIIDCEIVEVLDTRPHDPPVM